MAERDPDVKAIAAIMGVVVTGTAEAERLLDALTESIGATVEAGLIARLRLKLESIKVDGPTKYALEKLLEDG